jgi:6-phosphogluconolactonase
MDPQVVVYPTPYELAEKFAEELMVIISEKEKSGEPFTMALSGGTTPELLYSVLGDHFSASVNWNNVHFFWGDERCVLPESAESNYGMTSRALLRKIKIPDENIHRIHGENDPYKEAKRYSQEIKKFTAEKNGFPVFDLIILGLGEDGHTASIFPSSGHLLNSDNICEVAFHPVSQQRRITLTGKVLNNAAIVSFLVTGSKKAEIVGSIINRRKSASNFPASAIVPTDGRLSWYLDSEAAAGL